jgi:hypothetical protein
MSQQTPSEPTGSAIESEKLACDLAFFSSANVFAESAIAKIPELQAVAVIPLWAPQLENVPTGILRLRDEQAPYLSGLLQMLGRIAAFSVDVHKDMVSQIKAFDRMAANLVAEIKAKSVELHEINQQLSRPADNNNPSE